MHPSRRVGMCALVLAALAVLVPASRATTQSYDDARHSAQLSSSPFERSPRKLGMGRLELVIEDDHMRFNLWDFAQNPTGIFAADSVSTFEFRPSTGSASSVADRAGDAGVEQSFAARGTVLGFEGWRRAGSTAYGFIGDLSGMRTDDPYSSQLEQRTNYSVPSVQGVMSGPMPYVKSHRLRYAARIHYGFESDDVQFRAPVSTYGGTWLDRDGAKTNQPPNVFIPDQVVDNRLGGGVAVSYDLTKDLVLATGYDLVRHKFVAQGLGDRYLSRVDEERWVNSGQVSLVGRVGPHLEIGADANVWTSDSYSQWRFTISAGQQAIPLSGRGKYGYSSDEGSTMRSRARWTQGALQIGAGLSTSYQKTVITAPDPADHTSFNYFRNTVYYRYNADSLALPDSVHSYDARDHAYDASFGLAWTRLPHHAQLGVEFHDRRDIADIASAGSGPKWEGWDVRTGLDLPLSPAVSLSGGYIYSQDDMNSFTRSNEWVTHTITAGLCLRPARASWSLETGYAIDMVQADYGDPMLPRSSRQQLAAQLSWGF
jgi:hypothetical protein